MRILLGLLAALFIGLQWQIWVARPAWSDVQALRAELAAQRAENARLRERNAALAAEVNDLKQGGAAVEERARTELGMVKEGETFYQVVRPAPAPTTAQPATPPP